MNQALYEYEGHLYPTYLLSGDACRFIIPFASHFCKGRGLDVGAGKWPFPGATPIDIINGGDAMNLPEGAFDFIVSSHALEHLTNPIAALEHWQTRLRSGGVLFLNLPHPTMRYWNTTRNRRHLHEWRPRQMRRILRDLGYLNVIGSRRDLSWSFCCVGWAP